MFGIFGRKQKKIEHIAANIATLLNIRFWSFRLNENGDLPNQFRIDKYILGYIYGVTGASAFAGGVSKASEKGLLVMNVFDVFFPEDSQEIVTRCTEFANSNDELFMEGVNKGVDESAVIYKAMISGDEEAVKDTAGALSSLENHLSKNYSPSAT